MGKVTVGFEDEFARVRENHDQVRDDASELSRKIHQHGWVCMDDMLPWIREKGYTLFQFADREYILHKENSYYHITLRFFYDGLIVMVESTEDIEEVYPDEMALGLSLDNPSVFPMWRAFRYKNYMKNAICTRRMPGIVTYLLKCVHHIEDQDILFALQCRLTHFGTESFGDTDCYYPFPAEISKTPYHICYAPGEIEAITDVSAELLKGINTVEGVNALDMSRFTALLQEKSANIMPTPDIAMFGRKLHGCGLNEYESAVQLSMPVQVG